MFESIFLLLGMAARVEHDLKKTLDRARASRIQNEIDRQDFAKLERESAERQRKFEKQFKEWADRYNPRLVELGLKPFTLK